MFWRLFSLILGSMSNLGRLYNNYDLIKRIIITFKYGERKGFNTGQG